MFLIGWVPDYPHPDNFLIAYMASWGAFTGFTGYGNSTLDAQIAAAFLDTNTTSQQEKYYDLQQVWYDDPPGITLAQPFARRYFTSHIDGFYYNGVESSFAGRVYDLTKALNASGQWDGVLPYANNGTFVDETIGPDFDSLDPAWCYDTASGEQIGRIYETLLYYQGNQTDVFDPILATNWTWSDDDATWTFEIRPNVPFQSGGDNVTAEDVKYSIERAMCQDRPGGPVWMFFNSLISAAVWGFDSTNFTTIDSKIETSGNNVTFHVCDPAWKVPFLQVMCGQWASIVNKDWCIDQGDWNGTEADIVNHLHPTEPIDTALYDTADGTGPWKLANTADWDHGVSITLTKNPTYWGGSVPFLYVKTKYVEEFSIRKLDLMAGLADIIYVPADHFSEMDAESGLNVYRDLPSLTLDTFFFNMIIGGPS
jgi:peptide/nickel transport system substrate-binding protein